MTGSGDDDGGGLHAQVSAEITSIELKGPNNAGQARSGPARRVYREPKLHYAASRHS